MNQIMKVFENQHFKIDEGLFLPVRNIGSCVCHRPAVRKLLESNLNVSQVAILVGYSKASNFAAAF